MRQKTAKNQWNCIVLNFNCSQLLVPFPHKEIFKKSIQYSGAFKWNALPSELKEAPSYGIFKQKCKFFIFNKCSFYDKH